MSTFGAIRAFGFFAKEVYLRVQMDTVYDPLSGAFNNSIKTVIIPKGCRSYCAAEI